MWGGKYFCRLSSAGRCILRISCSFLLNPGSLALCCVHISLYPAEIASYEKYKGDARLQKTYVDDFLTKQVKINRGERKQWYIHDSHDAIVSAETFELVQKELARRIGRGGRFYDSPFTGKIVCGDCGQFLIN